MVVTDEFVARPVGNSPSGSPEKIILDELAGIRPDPAAPGFRHCIIAPHPVKGLEWVEAHHDSPQGRIAVKWRQREGRVTLEVTLPPGVSATLRVPGELGRTQEIGSGTHQFTGQVD